MKYRCYVARTCVTAIILAALLLGRIASAETELDNEFWISTSTNTANLGTLDNPFDGSTATKFDSVMGSLPPNSTIHILAGTYQTYGGDGWQIKSGQKILGSGIDVTILQLAPNATSEDMVMESGSYCTNVEIADLTCDCNYTSGTYTYCGLYVSGTGTMIRRVKVINLASFATGTAHFGIDLVGPSPANSVGNIIEECEVSSFAGGGNVQAIEMNQCAGVVRNNHVYLSPSNIGESAFCESGASDVLVEGNYVDGADIGNYSVSGNTNITITLNTFNNVGQGVSVSGSGQNFTISYNTIALTTNSAYGSGSSEYAFNLGNAMTSVNIVGNYVGWDGAPNASEIGADYFLNATVQGLTVANNRVDAGLLNENLFVNSSYAAYGNYDLTGNLLTNLDQAESAKLSNELWISTNSNTANLGTLDNPFDGSTQSKFDALMSSLPPYSTIHLLAGTYQTKGDYGWSMKSGQRIIGAGEFTTTLQLQISGMQDAGISDDSADGRSDEYAEDVEDLTIDCNYQPGGDNDPYGIILGGTNIVVNHVRVIDGAYPNTNQTSEFFGIVLNGQDNTIENCEVSHFYSSPNNSISSICMNGTGKEINNLVVLTNSLGNDAFGIQSGDGVLVEGNRVEGASVGCYNDTTGWTNDEIVNNVFKNVVIGVNLFPNSTPHRNLLIKDNIVLITTSVSSEPGNRKGGFYLGGNNANITIEGNMVAWDGVPLANDTNDYFVGGGAAGLFIDNNRVDPLLDTVQPPNGYPITSPYVAYGNYDFNGNLLTNLNQTADPGGIVGTSEGGLGTNTSSWPAGYLPYTTGTGTFGSTAITPLGINLIDQTNAISALSLLGLTIGGTVQPYSADLSALAGLSPASGNLIVGNGSSWTTLSTNVFNTLAAEQIAAAAQAATNRDNEFWICPSTNTANLGTVDNPFDGSTQAKFDAVMGSLPSYSTIHLLAGTYQTKGDYGWTMKSGQRIIGAGEFTTTLQLQISGMQDAGISDDSADGRSDEFAEDVENLTIDCNYQPGGDNDPYGIILGGTNIVVNHVRVIDGAYPNTTQTSEFFGIMLNGWDNTIENCEVSHFIVANGNSSISAISMNGSGRELDNRVVLTNNVGAAFGVNANGTSGGGILVQGNFVEGAGVGSYNDTWGWTNCQFVDNQYVNVRFGIFTFPNSSGHQNILVKDNVVLLTTNAPFGSGAGKWAFDFGGNNTNITVEGNIVDFDGQPNPGELGYDYFMGGGSQGLVIHDNRVNALLDNDISSSYTAYNNYDFNGKLLTTLNQTADGGMVGTSDGGLGTNTSSWPAGYLPYTTGTGTFGSTAITPFGSSLIGEADATSAQSLLGLTIGGTVQAYSADLSALAGLSPASGNLIVGNGSSWTTLSSLPLGQLPGQVLTNNESQPVTFASSLNVSGNVTNSTLATTLGSTSGPTTILLPPAYPSWTNTTPENVVVYLQQFSYPILGITDNGTSIFNSSSGIPFATVMLQPGSYVSVECSGLVSLSWHPL